MTTPNTLTIRRPDDFHVHLREGAMLEAVLSYTAADYGRALVMPNLKQPVTGAALVAGYRDEIRRLADKGRYNFEPLMTIKLTQETSPSAIKVAKAGGVIAAKLYPEGVTTNSDNGVSDFRALESTLGAMQDAGLVLCVHPEEPGVFSLDREAAYLQHIEWAAKRFPDLKIVVEHVTTREAVTFVRKMGSNIAATITVHHLFLTLDDVIGDKLRPHNFCKPIAKRAGDRDALVQAATEGNTKFFLGTDSAPHEKGTKECDAGCAGCFTSPIALPLLADVFEKKGVLHRLEAFTSEHGASFYGLPLNQGKLTLERGHWQVPTYYGWWSARDSERESNAKRIVPFKAGETLVWHVGT
jgi:dihydroorotase